MATLIVGGLAAFTTTFGAIGVAGATAASIAATTFAFSTIAAAIDNFLLFPALFPPEDIKGERIEDFALSPAAEGSARNRVLGEQNRIGGQVIWIGAVQELEQTSDGGKGPSGPEITEYSYFSSVAIEVTDGAIVDVDRIWADANILYVNPDKTSLIQDTVTGTDIDFEAYLVPTGSPNLPNSAPNAVITGADVGSDTFQSGGIVTVSGFSASKNNSGYTFGATDFPTAGANSAYGAGGHTLRWTIRSLPSGTEMWLRAWAVETGSDPEVVTELSAYSNFYVATTESAGATVTLTANTASYHPDWVDSVTIYDGTQTTVDPTIDAEELVVPAFVNRSYFVLERLNLTQFGNRLPNFTAQVNEETAKPLSTAISDILVSAGLPTGQIDVSALTGITMEGYNIVGVQQPRSAIQPIMMTFNVAVQENNNTLTFYLKENASTLALDTDLIGTSGSGSPGSFTDQSERDRPTRINVKYIDPATDLQVGSQAYRKVDSPEQGVFNVDLQLTMTSADAQCRARRVLWASWANSRKFATSIAPRYYDILPGDIATFSYSVYDNTGTAVTASVRVFILTTTRGENGLIEVEGVIEDPQPFVSQLCETDIPFGYSQGSVPTDPPETQLEVIDLAPFREQDVGVRGAYYAGCLVKSTATWIGSTVYKTEGGSGTSGTFVAWRELMFETPTGAALDALANGDIHAIDRKNTVQVIMNHGTLASITRNEVNGGGNRAILGDEVIGFQTVVADGNNKYTLSNILRGQRGTKATDHSIGDRFILTNSNGFQWFETTAGSYYNFKLVPSGAEPSNYTAINTLTTAATGTLPENFLISGECRRPSPVCNIKSSRDASDNITITWERTTRSFVNGLANSRPVNEPYIEFELKFYRDATGAVALPSRTVITAGSLTTQGNTGTLGRFSFTYRASTQTLVNQSGATCATCPNPGWSLGDPAYVIIRQISPVGGGVVGRDRGVFTTA